jgi:hypothetical protein
MRRSDAVMRGLVFGLASLGLAGCGETADSLSDPNWQEGYMALQRAAPQLNEHLTLEQDLPKDCVAGKIGDEPIRSCKICVVLVRITSGRMGGLGGLAVDRGNFNIAFKRGISFEQPDVAPVDPASGVWVTASAGGPPSFSALKSARLDRGQIPGTEISMSGTFGGSVSYAIKRPGYLGVILDRNVLKEFLNATPAVNALAGLVGWCGPNAPSD